MCDVIDFRQGVVGDGELHAIVCRDEVLHVVQRAAAE